MGKRKYIKIPLPNWKWWQTALAIMGAILALRAEPLEALRVVKELLKTWLLGG